MVCPGAYLGCLEQTKRNSAGRYKKTEQEDAGFVLEKSIYTQRRMIQGIAFLQIEYNLSKTGME